MLHKKALDWRGQLTLGQNTLAYDFSLGLSRVNKILINLRVRGPITDKSIAHTLFLLPSLMTRKNFNNVQHIVTIPLYQHTIHQYFY